VNPSDATVSISEAMASQADQWPEAVNVPTSCSISESLDIAASVWTSSGHAL
jgi:hypothetical protein